MTDSPDGIGLKADRAPDSVRMQANLNNAGVASPRVASDTQPGRRGSRAISNRPRPVADGSPGAQITQLRAADTCIEAGGVGARNGGYRTSSDAQRKLQRVTEGQRLLVPDRRA
jgi:hypothetical protein